MSTKQVANCVRLASWMRFTKWLPTILDKAPDDVWAKRSMVWCLYEYVKVRAFCTVA